MTYTVKQVMDEKFAELENEGRITTEGEHLGGGLYRIPMRVEVFTWADDRWHVEAGNRMVAGRQPNFVIDIQYFMDLFIRPGKLEVEPSRVRTSVLGKPPLLIPYDLPGRVAASGEPVVMKGHPLLIDGAHRVVRAFLQGLPYLWGHMLTREEADQIKIVSSDADIYIGGADWLNKLIIATPLLLHTDSVQFEEAWMIDEARPILMQICGDKLPKLWSVKSVKPSEAQR